MPAVPAVPAADDKDWTWVLDRPCPDCGFDAGALDRERISDVLRASAVRWRDVLDSGAGSGGPDLRRRPEPTVWSPLEYAAHCRDVYAIFADRLRLMLEQDDPQFANWDQDETALQKRYWESDPAVVSVELGTAADGAVAAFGTVHGLQWERTGRRSNGSVFTVETLGQYFVHDLVHHLSDIGRPVALDG